MKEIKNILICGLGAIGSIYVAKIKDARVLVDKDRLERYKKNHTYFHYHSTASYLLNSTGFVNFSIKKYVITITIPHTPRTIFPDVSYMSV